MFKTFSLVCLCVLAVAANGFAGRNPSVKAAVHVLPHASRNCTKMFPSVGDCESIAYTEPSPNVDVFPVFFDLVEYQRLDYGLTWPGMNSCVFTSCSDLTEGGIVWPGDGVSHAWETCQPGPIAMPGWGWIWDYGMVCIIAHPQAGGPNIGDCQPANDIPILTFCAGIGGSTGEYPCVDPPNCDVFPTALLFGTVVVGGPPVDKTFRIKNTGGGMLSGTVSEYCYHYEIISGGGVYLIAGGDSIVVTVRFEPTSVGRHGCEVNAGCGEVSCMGDAEEPQYATPSTWSGIKALFRD